MKLSKEELKVLKEYWYQKIKESGFKDIENKRSFFKEPLSNCYRNCDELLIKTKEDYFTLLTHIVEDPNTIYKNAAHQHIMRRHADGTKIKDIVQELQALGLNRDRKNIRLIIRRYVTLWKIRYSKS